MKQLAFNKKGATELIVLFILTLNYAAVEFPTHNIEMPKNSGIFQNKIQICLTGGYTGANSASYLHEDNSILQKHIN